MYRVLLWGCGTGYNNFIICRGYEQVEIIGFTDKKSENLYMDGFRYFTKREVLEHQDLYDYIIVTVETETIEREIISEIVSIGIDRNIVLPSRIFKIPFFNFDDYIHIKNQNISIVSDYCYGGYLSHKFGLQFLSPTINMWADNKNYFNFLQNIETYIKQPMEKIDNTLDNPWLGLYSFPRGRVGNSEWNFNHDITFESAAEKWKKRAGRFNLDNYIAFMTIRSDEMAYKFDALPIKHKYGFYWKKLNLPSIVYLPQWKDEIVRAKYAYDFSGYINRITDENGTFNINWMKLLLNETDFVRCI